jgi:hypothetical protein
MASFVVRKCSSQTVRWMKCIKVAQVEAQMALARACLDNAPSLASADITTHSAHAIKMLRFFSLRYVAFGLSDERLSPLGVRQRRTSSQSESYKTASSRRCISYSTFVERVSQAARLLDTPVVQMSAVRELNKRFSPRIDGV